MSIIEKLGITPGRWINNNYYGVIQNSSIDLQTICRYGNTKENSNNMKLISTAPEMLMWIIGMMESADNNDMIKAGKLLLLGDELLKKATGNSLEQIKELK